MSIAPKIAPWGFDFSAQDTRVRPGDDFFLHCNGGWVERTEIPSDKARYGMFDMLREQSDEQVRSICETDMKGLVDADKIQAAYRSFMDEQKVEARGSHPVHKELAAIAEASTKEDLGRLMGRSARSFHHSMFSCSIADDSKDPSRYAVYLGQDGLGLPDLDYYLKPEFATKLEAYKTYMTKMLIEAKAHHKLHVGELAQNIVALEQEIAAVSWTRAERRDDNRMYNAFSRQALMELAPEFPWAPFLEAASLGKVDQFVVCEVTAFPKIADIFARTPIETLKWWCAFHVLDSAAPYLSKRLVDAEFNFRGRTLSGQQQLRPRWKRAVSFASVLGESVGQAYVARHFPESAKAKVDHLVSNVVATLQGRLRGLSWMTPSTKAAALEKLSKITLKIGYPSQWRNYDSLQLDEDDLFGNAERSQEFEWQFRLDQLAKPVDREEWAMFPQTVNAYANSNRNEIVFPAAILQPPFFDPNADAAVNYGGIGGVIAHEISHLFDDSGSRYDGDGRLRDWWTPEDKAAFDARTASLAAQYSRFEPVPGHFVNGQLTLGENAADSAGLSLALEAYTRSLGSKQSPVRNGTSGSQRVFLAWAQVWRSKQREDSLKQQLVSDPHSPPQYRVNGVVQNMAEWYAAFQVKPSHALFIAPQQRVQIW